MINLLLKLSGLGWVWTRIDGYKTYIAGGALMLSGLASMCTGLAGFLGEIIPMPDMAAMVSWLKGMGHNTNAGLVLAGWAMFAKGLGDVGLRHAQDKTAVK